MSYPPTNPRDEKPHLGASDAVFGQRLLEAFEAVTDLSPSERAGALETLEAESPDLARALRALLARDERTGPLDNTLSAQIQPLLREALPELDPTPAQIGPYTVLRLLGEGGMGRVYLARRSDGPVAREVAIKLIRPDRAGAGLLARFEAERRHLAALDHPGICRFIDADSLADGTPYVVMEAVEGEPIIDYCQRKGLGLRARVELLRKLLDAVAHAHDRLLLHRDIKPHNVLVTAEGEPKLLDFGIAKSIEDAETSVTRTAERFFTPNASAPEQLLGEPAGVACDVYSLGALAYELLSGALPFEFKDLRAAEIERLILQVAPPLMSERSAHAWARELRGDLDAIIATCLRKAPSERYRNVDALDAELQRWLEGRPVTARAPSWAYRSRLFVRRHRAVAMLGAAVVVLALGLVWSSIRGTQREAESAQQTVKVLSDVLFAPANDESEGDGLSMTATSLLERARARILDQTTLEAQQRFVLSAQLARRAMDLDVDATARSAAQEHLRLAEELYGNDGIEVAFALDLVAESVIKSRDRQAANSALAMLDRSAALYEQRDALQTMDYMGHLVTRAWLETLAEEFDRSVETLGRAAKLSGNIPNAPAGTHELHLSMYSMFLRNAGRWEDAEQVIGQALAAVNASGDSLPWATRADVESEACIVHSNLATARSIEICQQRVSSLERGDALESNNGATALLGLAIAQSNRGALTEALTSISRSEAVTIAYEGRNPVSDNMRHIQLTRARILAKMLRWDEAVAAYHESIRLFIARDGEASARIGRTRVELIETLLQAGRPAEAREVVEAGVAIDEADEKSMQRWREAQEALRLAES